MKVHTHKEVCVFRQRVILKQNAEERAKVSTW